jgi:hypothetical protein
MGVVANITVPPTAANQPTNKRTPPETLRCGIYQIIMPHFPLPSSLQHATCTTSLSLTCSQSFQPQARLSVTCWPQVHRELPCLLSRLRDRTPRPRPATTNYTHIYIIITNPSTLAKHSPCASSTLSRPDKHLPCRQPQAEPPPRNLHAGKADSHFARFPSWTIA